MLKTGAPNDKYEREADRVAEQVMAMPEPNVVSGLTQGGAASQSLRIQRFSDECEEALPRQFINQEGGALQMKLHGDGQPLSMAERDFFEPRFNMDFSQVCIHNDARAANMARSVNARAFTLGHDVVFGAGEYSPNTSSGRKLLAHELVHTVQQGRATLASERRGAASTPHGISSDRSGTVRREPPADVTFSLSHEELIAVESRVVQAVSWLRGLSHGLTFAERVVGYLEPLSRHIGYREASGREHNGETETVQFVEGQSFSLRLVLSDAPGPRQRAYFQPDESGAGGVIVLNIQPQQEVSESLLPRSAPLAPGEASGPEGEEASTTEETAPQSSLDALREQLRQPERTLEERLAALPVPAQRAPVGIEGASARILGEALYHETMHFLAYCVRQIDDPELIRQLGDRMSCMDVQHYLDSMLFSESVPYIETIIRCVNANVRGEDDQILLTEAQEYADFLLDEALARGETLRLLNVNLLSSGDALEEGRQVASYLFLYLMRQEDRVALAENEEAEEAYRWLGRRLGVLISDQSVMWPGGWEHPLRDAMENEGRINF